MEKQTIFEDRVMKSLLAIALVFEKVAERKSGPEAVIWRSTAGTIKKLWANTESDGE